MLGFLGLLQLPPPLPFVGFVGDEEDLDLLLLEDLLLEPPPLLHRSCVIVQVHQGFLLPLASSSTMTMMVPKKKDMAQVKGGGLPLP